MSVNQLGLWDFCDDLQKPIKSTDWKWNMATDYPQKNGLKVFSCFACGGGSTMGYKLAGCEVIGDLEIDKRMNDVYVANHHPKHNFLMDIREFNKKEDLPEELYNLDILDGSPPCTTFSTSGKREKTWGVKKAFREGQVEQTLDDLLFVFLDTVDKLRPKTFIMENVEGLTLGNAWSYVQKIYAKSKEIGYKIKHWLLKGENMGIPQTRHRVFFIGVRENIDFNLDKVDMSFNYAPIAYREIKDGKGAECTEYQKYWLRQAIDTDNDLFDIQRRIKWNGVGFSDYILRQDNVCMTITANGKIFDLENLCHISNKEIINATTFPQDFDFMQENIRYVCGMSVPPIMIKRVVERLIECKLFNI